MSIDARFRRQLPAVAPRATILIVDADADTRALYRAIFPPNLYDVDDCDDGAVALGHAIARPPDLVITETHLRRIDGFALCRLLRADPLTRSIPIVVVTSAASPADGARAVQAGANLVLVKPCDPAAVVNAVSHALARSGRDASGAPKTVPSEHAASGQAAAALASTAVPLKPRRRSRGFQRHTTTTPPSAPPVLRCPRCDEGLAYQHSHIGGVNEQSVEQWDYFECRKCGTYQYRHRTRKLKAI